ncbi:glycoside hydrolase family 15 protein [Ramlibacter sp.]
MASRIEDYALIGNCRSAALVARDGSIDWLCLPRFDSGACFAALLGSPGHGRWLVAPAGDILRVRRQYRPDTLLLETTFETATGSVTLTDFMPPMGSDARVVRIAAATAGEVAMHMELVARFDYGSIAPWVSDADGCWRAIAGPDALVLHTPCRTRGQGAATVADFTLRAGETMPFVLGWHASHEPGPEPLDPALATRDSERWWLAWMRRCIYEGPWREAVHRSLVTLKALTYAPTGGIVAAPTTSLPECIGGVRNWDYRFCWVRDAAFTLYTLLMSGYTEEASAWSSWLARAVAGTPSQLNIMYGVQGERRLTELQLEWLGGYEQSRPVRIGNAAHRQFQLDVFGEIATAMHLARAGGLPSDDRTWNIQREQLRFLEEAWQEPDEGIWEVRGPRRHFTHSKVMAWLAVDRMIASAERFGLPGPVDRWRTMRAAIHNDVCRKGVDPVLGTFVQHYGGHTVDASLLLISLSGFLPAADTRVRRTIAAVQRELMADGFVRRYVTDPEVEGLPAGEGVFIPCTLWLANVLFELGRRNETEALFERVLAVRNDVGLLSEEYDPVTRRQLGNFPQAFSHVAVLATALQLSGQMPPLAPARSPVGC